MSLVYITHHDENIFDVDRRWQEGVRPTVRYTSKYRPQVVAESKKQQMIDQEDGKKLLTSAPKCKHKTMGYAETPIDPPCAYLRKQQGVRWRRLNEHVCPKSGGMPPVPRYVRTAEDKPPPMEPKKRKEILEHCPHRRYFKNHKHRANFIAMNIERIKTAETKRPPPRYIDTPLGDRHTLLNTGLIPQYICGKNFGKVPCYLRVQKKMLQDIRERCAAEQKRQEDECLQYMHPGVRRMTHDERQTILTGLKNNLVEVNSAYQKLPLYTDTIAKKQRKSKVEKDLSQLEQDIYLIESNPVIYITDY